MNVVVSLIRDNLANLQRFVSGNLAGGADHLLIALDGPHDRSVYDFLTAHDRVSWVLGDAKWWTPPRTP